MEGKVKTQRFKLYDVHAKNRCVNYIQELPDVHAKNRCVNYIQELPLAKEPYEIIVRPYNKKNQRSIDQNNRYWHIIREAANEIGYTANELHSIMSVQILGTNTITNLDGEPVTGSNSNIKFKCS
jgi:hypothetical protein